MRPQYMLRNIEFPEAWLIHYTNHINEDYIYPQSQSTTR